VHGRTDHVLAVLPRRSKGICLEPSRKGMSMEIIKPSRNLGFLAYVRCRGRNMPASQKGRCGSNLWVNLHLLF
jgi:hypothetical protein